MQKTAGPMPTGQTHVAFRVRHGAGWATRFGGALVAGGLSWFFWQAGIAGFPALLWYSFATGVVLTCLTFGETESRAAPPRVVQRWRFMGLILVWRREHSLGAFRGVQCRQYPGSENDSLWHVGFVGPTGRFLAVQWYHCPQMDYACTEASVLAAQLAELSGLPQLEAQWCHPA